MVEAKRQKDCFMEEIRKIKASIVEIVDIDDICENGIVCEMDKVNAIVDKMKNRKIDALFFPFCDFGEEQVVAAIASKFTVPILIWGPRDERPNTDEARGRDTQCGMFAATKVLQRYGLKYSYIYNCTTKSEEFLKGYETFIRTAAVLKSLRTLRIAKIGERPVPFMSVMTNEANLIKRFGITTVPISPVEICNRARKILEEKGKEYIKYEEEFVRKFPDGENYQQICATKLAVQELMEENNCSVAAFECWSAFPTLMGLCPCVVLGEMADNGMPLSCETDINGAITLAILRACNLFEESEFLADLTIRHPQNDNAELLWHCGPFPYSLKKDGVEAKLVDGQERFELKQGDLTVCRFDDVDGEYYLFAGEAKTTTGPETNAAINTLNIETVKYVIEAAERERVPIIVQFYPGFSDYTDLKHLAFAACDMAEKASIPVGVHLDHSVTYEIAVGGIRDGFPSVMIDGSTKSFQENVELTKNVVRVAKVFGVDVEAELGHVGNGDSIDAIDNTNYYTKVEAKAGLTVK